MRIRLAVLILILLVGLWMLSLLSGWTLCIFVHENLETPRAIDAKIGDIISPLEGLDLNHGKWTAYLILGLGDFRELKGQFGRNCLRLSDLDVLKEMQSEWKMTYQGGDIATTVSQLILTCDGKIAFSSGIVLTNQGVEGLQSRTLGWLQPESPGTMWKYCKMFKPVYSPIIVL